MKTCLLLPYTPFLHKEINKNLHTHFYTFYPVPSHPITETLIIICCEKLRSCFSAFYSFTYSFRSFSRFICIFLSQRVKEGNNRERYQSYTDALSRLPPQFASAVLERPPRGTRNISGWRTILILKFCPQTLLKMFRAICTEGGGITYFDNLDKFWAQDIL